MASPTTAAAGDTRCERPYPPFAPRRLAARRTHWPARSAGSGGDPLFDDLIRPQQQRRRDGEAEGAGGFEVDDQLEIYWAARPADRRGPVAPRWGAEESGQERRPERG